jgi:hypothetical protein
MIPRLRFGLTMMAMMFLISQSLAQSRTPAGDPEIQENGAVRFSVQGKFRGNVNAARDSAVEAAQERLRSWLAEQAPPIRHVPSLDTIRREMIRQQETPEKEQVDNETQYRVTLSVEMQPSHIRALRARDRTGSGIWMLGGVLAILGVVALFFRVDEWTKGYLTRWLIAGGIAVIAGLIAALFLGR